jgi:glutamyl-tRNA synthetase
LAYWDYATSEEAKAEREAAEKEKRSYVASRRWMAETPADRAKFEAQGRTAVVRLKMPREGVCEFHDHIRGPMRVEWAGEQDHVVQRADGTCLYNLANVVDDFDMKITHVIRAEEHLSNTPRQIFIARGLGYPLPEYAHVPFVAEPGSKRKLSKRELDKYLKNPDFKKVAEHGKTVAARLGLSTKADTFNPVIVDFYAQVGYLPDALVNYLLLLGWSLDDKTEFFTREEMIRCFGVSWNQISKSPASFDAQKLWAFQDAYMQRLALADKVRRTLPFLQKAGIVAEESTVRAIVEAAGDRIKTAGDILDYVDFFTPDEQLPYDEKALEKYVRKPPQSRELLAKFRAMLTAVEPFEASVIEKRTAEFAVTEGIELKQLMQPVRVAATGKAVSFGLYETLAILGKERCLRRLQRAIEA